MTLQEIYEKVIQGGDSYYSDISKVYYNNHKYSEKEFNLEISPEIAKIIIDYQNSITSNWIKKVSIMRIDARLVGTIYFGEQAAQADDYRYYDTSFNTYKEDIVKFVKDNENVEVDPDKEFYQIYFYDYNSRIPNIFYTNKIDEINNILEKEHELSSSYYQDTKAIY